MTGGSENICDYCNYDSECLSLERNRQFFLSLDLDLTKIKSKNKIIQTIAGTFGFIKIPFPAIEISNNKADFHIIYF